MAISVRHKQTDSFILDVSKCNVCKNSCPQYIIKEEGIFYLLGIALFHAGTNYYRVCDQCNARRKTPFNVLLNNTQVREKITKSEKLSLFSYTWGWIVLFIPTLLILALFLF